MHTTFDTICNIQMQKKPIMSEDCGRKKKKGESRTVLWQGGNIILRKCSVTLPYLAVNVLLSHSFLPWLKSCAAYCRLTLMEDSYSILYPWQVCSQAKLQLLLTELVTQPKREPNVSTEREIGVERDGASSCHVFTLLLNKKTTNHWHISAAMETYLVTVPAPSLRCPIHDLRHSMSSLKQQGEQVRLDDSTERQEHERDYAPWDEARVTVSWTGVRGFVMVVSLSKWNMFAPLLCVRERGNT